MLGTTPRSSGSAASPRGSNKRPSKEEGGLLSPLASSHVRHMAHDADHQPRTRQRPALAQLCLLL